MKYRIIKWFITPSERQILLKAADTEMWVPGRQGTGYERASVRGPASKCLAELGVSLDTRHDEYLLRYPEGAFIPPHVGDALFGVGHYRINVLLEHAAEGGELFFDGERIELDECDEVVFRPDIILHEVKPVTKGRRLLWTVGVLK